MRRGTAPHLVRRELDWDLSAEDVLRLVRDDPWPVALTGSWAGGSDIVASEPTQVRSPPQALDDVLGAPSRDADPQPTGADQAPFGGGWIGYLGFALTAELLGSPPAPGDPRVLPPWWFGYYDHVLRRDRATATWFFEALWTDQRAEDLERRFAELTRRARVGSAGPRAFRCGDFVQQPSTAEHRAAVRRTVDRIGRGDLVQANICLRLDADFTGDPLDAFCRARAALDPPYAAFLRVPGGAVASLSPELFLHRCGALVTTRPIKGTRRRPADAAAAARERELLLASAKDRAENVMIVDLMRNDLSRVSRPGSVVVPRLLAAEAHPGLWHLVSDVQGTLEEGTTDLQLVAATFPPGSVTGAPKVRAVELVHELESSPREVYTGAIGYRSPLRGLELNVAIRTLEFHDDSVWLGCGGGVTTRSDDADEHAEALLKAAPLVAALGSRVATGSAQHASLRPRPAAGVSSAMSISCGRVRDLEEHLARLDGSTRRLYRKPLPTALRAELEAAVEGRVSGQLRVTARPMGGPLQTTVELAATAPAPRSARLRVLDLPGGLGEHTWVDRRPLAAHVAELAADEQLLLRDGADLLETDRANLFAVIGGVLHTPPLDGRLVPGVTRDSVIGIAAAAGIPVRQAPLALADLARATEVFVTSSAAGVVPVAEVEQHELTSWSIGPVSTFVGSRLAVGWAAPPPGPAAPAPAAAPALRRSAARPSAGRTRPLIVLIDNYDSFTYNLAHLLLRTADVEVVHNDEVSVRDVVALAPDGVVISPGPCTPAEAGISVATVRDLGATTPILGVCLGHQAIAVAYGARVGVASRPVHGEASPLVHDGEGLLRGLPQEFAAARYHSLIVDESTLPDCLRVSARTLRGVPMGLRHDRHRVEGLQFHPESILTEHGARMIDTFVRTTTSADAPPPGASDVPTTHEATTP